jgi:hypothetical protein
MMDFKINTVENKNTKLFYSKYSKTNKTEPFFSELHINLDHKLIEKKTKI